MLATLAKSNPYLGIPEPDMQILYILAGVFVVATVFVVIFRGLGKWNESRKVKASSWRTFSKIAKVKGLTNLERKTLEIVVRKANPKRPSQVLASIILFDRCVDQAVDRDIISDVEQTLMETAREKLIRTTVQWDGHKERRQFERAEIAFDIQVVLVPKSDIDEEMKSAYDEADTKFKEALNGLVAQTPSIGARVLNLSAGGGALLTQDKNVVRVGDYVTLSADADPVPFQIEGVVGKVISSNKMQDQGQLTLHVGFLPIEQEQRRQIIATVYATTQGSPASHAPKKQPERKPQEPTETSTVEDAAPVSDAVSDGSESPPQAN